MSKLKELLNQVAVYIPNGCEPIRVDAVLFDEGQLIGMGEDTGNSYTVELSDIDLDNDSLYGLHLLNK